MMIKYIAGWDGGGTKTICEVRSLDGRKTTRFSAGTLNPNGNARDQTNTTVAALLKQMTELTGSLDGCKMLCIGAAGSSNPDTVQFVRTFLEKCGYNGAIYFTGDQQTALYGALGEMSGAVLIAGTGSICYGQNAIGCKARAGGWGSLMDDVGGGYVLGRDILTAVVRAEDGRGSNTCLRNAVFNYMNVDNVQELIRAVYSPDIGKKEIAALAPLLDDALLQKDTEALKILNKAATELAMLAHPVVEKLKLQDARMVLTGSVLTKCLPIRKATIQILTTDFPALDCVLPMYDAATGAVLLAQKALEQDSVPVNKKIQ